MSKPRIRVQIIDDHDLIVEGVKSILQGEPDLEPVFLPVRGEAEVLEAIRACQPDVLLLDAKMPDFDLLGALAKITALFPRLRVIIVTAQQDPLLVKAVAKAGTAGYVLKEEGLSSLLPVAIRDVARGKRWFSPRASQYLFQEATAAPSLNANQRDVLRLMVCGKSPSEIAQVLQRSVWAIYNTQERLREKLGAATNEQVIIAAVRERLVPLAPDKSDRVEM
jgi:DNA-binding NarL/FixJ family response regulator